MNIFPNLNFMQSSYKNQNYRVAYTTWGSREKSKKVLFCVHGLLRNSRDFDFVAEYFVKKGYFVICPDIVGRGNSDYLNDYTGYNLEVYMKDICSLFGLYDLQQVDYIGFSMGGILGMLASNIPLQLIKNLVLVDIGYKIEPIGLMRILNYASESTTFDSLEQANEVIKKNLTTFGPLSNELFNVIIGNVLTLNNEKKYVYKVDPNLSLSFKDALNAVNAINLLPYWENINIPVLIIRGENSDLLSREVMLDMCKKPKTYSVEIKDSGHAPFLYNDEHFKILENFFNK